MRIVPLALVATLWLAPAFGQQRSAPKKDPTFPEAVEQAKKAADAEQYGAAIAALHEAIAALQKKQRVAILASLPKPDGWTVKDDEPNDADNPFAAGMALVGMNLTRRYRNNDKSLTVEITANSPMMQMMSMMFNNPALLKADGGEIVQYGAHKAILKKNGDSGSELQILMHDKHLIKVTSQGISDDDLLKIFDQAFVDRMEKPLGK